MKRDSGPIAADAGSGRGEIVEPPRQVVERRAVQLGQDSTKRLETPESPRALQEPCNRHPARPDAMGQRQPCEHVVKGFPAPP